MNEKEKHKTEELLIMLEHNELSEMDFIGNELVDITKMKKEEKLRNIEDNYEKYLDFLINLKKSQIFQMEGLNCYLINNKEISKEISKKLIKNIEKLKKDIAFIEKK
ncbi:MAG: hypothetical protein CMF69_03060 [Magnetovibrio sp.]|nr:hypothetical protein [Magnetovibrio sp.]|tara:strand:- start:93 stop:413 length:321 start_codon:yes stop_codon:yes gene_type:complete